MCFFFFFKAPATTEIYTLSLHDALPICQNHGARIQIEDKRLIVAKIRGPHMLNPQAMRLVSRFVLFSWKNIGG